MEATEVGRRKQCGRGEARMDGKRGRTARGGRASPPLAWPREETEGEPVGQAGKGGGGRRCCGGAERAAAEPRAAQGSGARFKV